VANSRRYKRRGAQLTKRSPKRARERRIPLTLREFAEAISDPIVLTPSKAKDRRRAETLARLRQPIREGDAFALLQALDRLFLRLPHGVSHHDSRDPDGRRESTVPVPAWLLGELFMMLSEGLAGRWPTVARGRGAPLRRQLDANRDVWCAWHVLKAMEHDVTLTEATERVADMTKGGRQPMRADAIKKAYYRVADNLKTDPDYYKRLQVMPPRLLDSSVGPPYRS
jgi:hypothetical protein